MIAAQTVEVVGTPSAVPLVPAHYVAVDWTVLIPLIVSGVGILLGQVLNYLKSRSNGQKSDAIHVLVNSGMQKALADNAAQVEEIRTLRALVQALNVRISALPVVGLVPAAAPGELPTRADVERAEALIDASRLPSAEVLAAQAKTPAAPPR